MKHFTPDSRIEAKTLKKLKNRGRTKRRRVFVAAASGVLVLAMAVVLVYPAFALEKQVYCGFETEHTEACYEDVLTLVCSLEESEGHTHTDECYETVKTLVCSLPEDENHTHGPECWQEEKRLICNLQECAAHTHTEECYAPVKMLVCGKQVHEHTLQCFSNPEADVENSTVWEQVTAISFSGDIRKDLVSVANTQVGYKESENNYLVAKDGVSLKGYTRYGDKYGDRYADWSVLFCRFCMDYAHANPKTVSPGADTASWAAKLKQHGLFEETGYSPEPGDIVFMSDGHCGIVTAVNGDKLTVVEGDRDNSVQRICYSLSDSKLTGFGVPALDNALLSAAPAPVLMSSEDPAVGDGEPAPGDGEASDIFYSSDLADFLDSVVITDTNGEEIKDNGKVYLGEKYRLSVSFIENNDEGEEKQFSYNDEGWLTYQFGTGNLKFSEMTDGIIYGTGNVQIGEYTVDKNGLLKVKFYYLDENGEVTTEATGLNIIDKSATVFFEIELDVELETTGDEEKITIDFGDDITIHVDVNRGGELSTVKTASTYNDVARTVTYTVKTKCDRGRVEELSFTDVRELEIDNIVYGSDSLELMDITVKKLDGTPVYDAHGNPVKSLETLNGIDTALSAGEGFVIEYTLKLGDDVTTQTLRSTGELKNTFTAQGITPEGPVSADDSTSTQISLRNFSKNGAPFEYETESGEKVKLIRWMVSAGDYVNSREGFAFTDTLGDGLSFYTELPPEYTIQAPDKITGTLEWHTSGTEGAVIHADNPSVADFYVPETGTRCYLVYYTEYSKGDVTYENKIDIKPYPEETSRITMTGGGTTIFKEHYDEDTRYIYYTISAFVPAGNYNKHVFIADTLQCYGYNNIQNYPEQYSVFAEDPDGTRTELLPYGSGEGESTEWGEYYFMMPLGVGAFKNQSEGTFNLLLDMQDYRTAAKWPYETDKTVIINYAVPKTAANQQRVPITTLLNSGVSIDNTARLYVESLQVCQWSDSLKHVDDLAKTGAVTNVGEGLFHYKAAMPNVSGLEGTTCLPKLKSAYHDMYIVDDYDDRLEYVQGSMKAYVYSRPTTTGYLSGVVTQYKGSTYYACYACDEVTASEGSLIARLSDFSFFKKNINFNGADYSGYPSLEYLLRKNPEAFCVVFEYDMKLQDEYMAIEYAQQEMKLDNEIRLGYVTDGANYLSDPATATVPYINRIIEKTGSELNTDDTLDFQIVVNSQGSDLTPLETVTIDDVMSDSLLLYLDTVTVETGTAGTDTWTRVEDPQLVYNLEENKLSVKVPDDVPVRISYTCKVQGKPNEQVSISNYAGIEGYYNCINTVDAEYIVYGTAGGGGDYTSSEIYLLKQDEKTLAPLGGAVFALYGPYNTSRMSVVPSGIKADIIAHGERLYYYRTFETELKSGALNGSFTATDAMLSSKGHYAFVETRAPEGYEKSDTVCEFYMQERPENGNEEIPVLENRGTLTVKNAPMLKISVTKEWSDSADEHPAITVELYEEVERVKESSIKVAAATDSNGNALTLTLSEDNGWQGEFEKLDPEKTYYIRELRPEGYVAVYSGGDTVRVFLNETVFKAVRVDNTQPSVTITNAPGALIVNTGGPGTVLLYAAGVLLMTGAAFMLIRKRRKHLKEQ